MYKLLKKGFEKITDTNINRKYLTKYIIFKSLQFIFERCKIHMVMNATLCCFDMTCQESAGSVRWDQNGVPNIAAGVPADPGGNQGIHHRLRPHHGSSGKIHTDTFSWYRRGSN